MKCDAVFEGGGVNGIGLCGAVAVVEAKGYTFNRVAGTSAGAIVAALTATGHNAAQLLEIIGGTDYTKFRDKGGLDHVPIVGPIYSIFTDNGIYEGDYFHSWMRKLLANSPSGAKTFGQIKDSEGRHRLKVIAADISRRKLLVLPDDIAEYGLDPDNLEIATAVRMSMSIPVFFESVCLNHPKGPCQIVDGGLLSNFPVWLFDRKDGQAPRWPTFGFLLEDRQRSAENYNRILNPLDLCLALIMTMLEAHDSHSLKMAEYVRTICIDTLGNPGTNFSLDAKTRDRLYASGALAAGQFFRRWNFDAYIDQFRKPQKEV